MTQTTKEGQNEYQRGFNAGYDDSGVLGGESSEWLRGFTDGTEFRIELEIAERNKNDRS